MYCRNCGSEVNEKAMACPTCGLAPLTEKHFCQECGSATNDNQIICVKCGVKLRSKGFGAKLGEINFDISAMKNFDKSGILDSDLMKPISIIAAIAMVILLFLPWYSWHSEGFGYTNSGSLNAIHWVDDSVRPLGVIMLLCAIGCLVSNFIKFKWAIILGCSNILLALYWIIGLPSGGFNAGGYNTGAGVAWGAYLFFIAASAYIAANIKTLKVN